MAKQKKKRNKAYTGANASIIKPTVMRVKAENRSKLKQWWLEKKRFAKPAAIAGGVGVVVIWLLVELARAISGGAF